MFKIMVGQSHAARQATAEAARKEAEEAKEAALAARAAAAAEAAEAAEREKEKAATAPLHAWRPALQRAACHAS